MEFAIRTEHLTKIYGHRLIAVNDLKLDVPRGSIFGLLGPNGAGKTTTLRLLLGLQRPSAGRAEVFSECCGPNAIQVRSHIGHLPTNPNFQYAPMIALILFPYLVFPWFLVVLALGISPVSGAQAETLADSILSRPVSRLEYLLAT